MRAIVASRPGGPEVLEIIETAEPDVRPGEVKIRVRAFGLNKAESYYRSGNYGIFRSDLALGYEAVGEVVEDSNGVLAVGQRVATAMGGMMITRHGGYADYISVDAKNVVPIDSLLAFEELAALPEAYLTVWGALEKSLRIVDGQTLLVRGATSSVGMAAVAYAKMRGLNVLATTRQSEATEKLISIGADHVVIDDGEIRDQVRAINQQGVDHAIEVVGAATLLDTASCIRPWGEVVVVGLLAGPPVLSNLNLMMDIPNTVKLSFFNSQLLGTEALPLTDSPLDLIAEQVASGRMPSALAKVYPFDDIQEAHRLLDSGRAGGKIVVRS
ncbi:MAG: zinc-binding dehydrogenase [Acidimicrobiia bacterium]|nr:zinc-binding dehydrogenase [Acidimicrobiia bacterium]MDH3396285.1 zinc-binding dehydrogenase [Acidimicrobiia bacterium]